MPVERRLRDAMQRNASTIQTRVDEQLETVIRRGRHQLFLARVTASLIVVAVVVGTIVIGPRLLRSTGDLRRQLPAGTPTVPSVAQSLVGSFTRVVHPSSSVIRTNRLEGRWTIDLLANGRMIVSAPPSYNGIVSAVQFEARGASLRTDLFGQDVCSGQPPGTYRWSRAGQTLTFIAADDACTGRVDLLAGSWRSA